MLHCQKAIDGPKNKQGFQFQHGAGQYSGGNAPKANFSGGVGSHMPAGGGHLMAPSATGMGYQAPAAQPAAAVGGINPAVNQALTALLLGGLGPAMNQGVPGQMGGSGVQGGYASGQMGYGGQPQGGYGGAQMGQGRGTGTWAQGGGPPYMGHH
ncbi:uncharacterized protein A4U43_C05F27570 [Asparagus officinalis]|uniref:Uncharacterized protein n=2 Tax=Asparagus officinalis TaxID=4686 RepID=A0A5P1EWI5_ASPOF|nr:uncharacterized protein A4U43_C05F27570 [Asparagus officinalis]